MTGTVTIPLAVYIKLRKDSDFLECLKGCGVDNWDGYSDAKQMYREEDDE